MHLVGPDGRVQLQPAGDGDHFLAVRNAPRAYHAWHGHALGFAQIRTREFRAAAGARAVTGDWGLVTGGRGILIEVFLTSHDGCGRFLPALRANIHIFAERNFQRLEDVLFVETEALAIGDVAHVRAEFSVGPKEITDGRQQLIDVVVLLDQFGDIAGGAGGGDIFERLRGLRVEPHARHVLRKHGDERQTEALIEIRDELVARHLFERAVVAGALLERQMPVHVVRIPPGILQTLPKEPSLANPPDFVPPRDDAFLAVLPHQLAQRVY